MIELLLKNLENHSSLSIESKKMITRNAQEKTYKKGELFQQTDCTVNHIGFVASGIFRQFMLKKNQDVTLQFIVENEFVANFDCYNQNVKSDFCIECETEAEVCYFSKEVWRLFELKIPGWKGIIDNIQVKKLLSLTSFQRSILNEDALTSYNLFLQKFPEVAHKVQLGHMASFLGIAQPTLSRIRKKSLQ